MSYEPLAQVLLWWEYRFGGFAGIIASTAALSLLTLFLVDRACAGPRYLSVYVTLLVFAVLNTFVSPKPLMFTYLFVSVFILILDRTQRGQWSAKALYLLPPLMGIWANLHGGFAVGLGLLLLYAAGGWVDGQSADWQRALRTVFALSLVATLFTLMAAICWPPWASPSRMSSNSISRNGAAPIFTGPAPGGFWC